MDESDNLFLIIDGYEVPDLEEGDYTVYEEELGVSERMISGRRIEELRATVWVVELNFSSITAEAMQTINTLLKASREHELFFLPSTGGDELVNGVFHLVDQPSPSLSRWSEDGPLWSGYKLRFEEVTGH